MAIPKNQGYMEIHTMDGVNGFSAPDGPISVQLVKIVFSQKAEVGKTDACHGIGSDSEGIRCFE